MSPCSLVILSHEAASQHQVLLLLSFATMNNNIIEINPEYVALAQLTWRTER